MFVFQRACSEPWQQKQRLLEKHAPRLSLLRVSTRLAELSDMQQMESQTTLQPFRWSILQQKYEWSKKRPGFKEFNLERLNMWHKSYLLPHPIRI